jgi:hypothetical protein
MAKWDAALYGTKLLKQSSLDRISTVYLLNDGRPNFAGYGFGWMMGEQNGHKRIEHGGAWEGFSCRITRYTDDSLTVMVFTNLDAEHSRTVGLTRVIAGLVAHPLLPPKLVPIADTQPELTAALVNLLDQLAINQDVSVKAADGTAMRIVPDRKWLIRRLANLWPGGKLALVKRMPAPNPAEEPQSVFRLSKGNDSALIFIHSPSGSNISYLNVLPDRDYDW